jgi:hypothetical protein
MYYDFLVKIPAEKGKIFERTIKGVTYINYDERPMGEEITYNFDWESYECCSCGKIIHISGYICEYPAGAYNYEDINVEKVEDDE